MILLKYGGHYCEECKVLCTFYEQGLSCECDKPWITEVIYDEDYPDKWIQVLVTVENNNGYIKEKE